jgi:hypothetical protein
MNNRTKAARGVNLSTLLKVLCATTLVATAIALLSQPSHAQTSAPGQTSLPGQPAPPPPPPPPGSANFAQNKQKELDHIAAHMQILQTMQSCVQSASDHAALKACHDTAKQSEQQLRHH